MIWHPLQTEAKTKNYLVCAMSQKQTPVMTEPGSWGTSFDGYCIGLAAIWIAWSYAGKQFPVDRDMVCANPPWQASMSQTLSDTSKPKDWTGFWKAATAPMHLGLSSGLVALSNTNPTPDFIYDVVTKAYGCYGVSFFRQGGSHAIALRHARDNRMHLFDRNFGHFVILNHTHLKPFLEWYVGATGYGPLYAKGCGVIGITPPQGNQKH